MHAPVKVHSQVRPKPQPAKARQRIAVRLFAWANYKVLGWVLFLLVLGVSVLPLIHVVDSAFYAEDNMGLTAKRSLDAVIAVYTTREYLSLLVNAFVLALVVASISMVVGVTMAFIVARTDIRFQGTWNLLILMPMFLSPFTGLIAWVALGSERTGFINVVGKTFLGLFIDRPQPIVNIWSYAGTVWIMFLFFCPFAYLFTIGSLRSMDSSLEEASRMVGASYWQTIRRITLPLSSPAILAATILILILVAEAYTVVGVIGTNAGFSTLPWRMYQDMVDFPVHYAHAAAAGTILMWGTAFGVWLQHRMTRKSERFVTIGGKGFRGTPIKLGKMRWVANATLAFYVGSAVVLPFAALVMMSLMKHSAPMITADLFTLEHYQLIFRDGSFRGALINTVLIAVVAGAICVLGGLVISYLEVRRPSRAMKMLAFLGILPIAVPGIVYGAGLLWTYVRTPLYGSISILVLAYLAKFLPYGIIISRNGILQIHPELEQSARMSGAGPTRALVTITMPLLKATLISIFFFVMLMSIKELAASLVLYSQNSQVLSVLTWHYMANGNYQFAAAIGVVQTLIIFVIIIVTRLLFRVSLERSAAVK